MAEVNPRYKHDPKASPSLAGAVVTPPAITGVAAGTPGSFSPAEALPPADLAALKIHPVVGESGTAKPGAAWTTGQFVNLGTGTAHWDGSAWVAGAKTLAEEAAAE